MKRIVALALGLTTIICTDVAMAATNTVATWRQAVATFTNLTAGMREADAHEIVVAEGLAGGLGLGNRSGWTRVYPLADGTLLVLLIKPPIASTAPERSTATLDAAYINSNGVRIAELDQLPGRNMNERPQQGSEGNSSR
jgi:hypothetical protein